MQLDIGTIRGASGGDVHVLRLHCRAIPQAPPYSCDALRRSQQCTPWLWRRSAFGNTLTALWQGWIPPPRPKPNGGPTNSPCRAIKRSIEALRGERTRRPRRGAPPSNSRADGGRKVAVVGGVQVTSSRASVRWGTVSTVLFLAARGKLGSHRYHPSTAVVPLIDHDTSRNTAACIRRFA